MVEHVRLRSIPPDPSSPSGGGGTPATLDLALTVRDPETIRELVAHVAGRERDEFALAALRIGILALQQARGRVDAEAVRREGDRLMTELERRLGNHQRGVQDQVARSLSEYFDPQSGRFSERVERLVKKDGELEEIIRRQINADDSELARTLTSYVGEESPLIRILRPDASSGVVRSVGDAVQEALKAQRERILREFSLDNREGALHRLVEELTERHGKLGRDLQGSVEKAVGEFSLDNRESALSRLIRRVDDAQRQISREFSLDEEHSALARMRRELVGVLDAHKKENAVFQEEVKKALAEMQVRKETVARTTLHGDAFESAAYEVLVREAQNAGDVAESTGTGTGLIKNCKVGDIVVTLGPDSRAAGARIVVEAKEKLGYDLAKAHEEIEVARKNRGAEVGLFVFSARTAPESLSAFGRYGSDIFVVWDADDPATDVFLVAGLSVAKALSTRAIVGREDHSADFDGIERSIRAVEKQLAGLDEVKRSADTIQSSGSRILDRVRKMREELIRQIGRLDELFGDLKQSLE